MRLGFATERNPGTSALDSIEEFKKGVELLKSAYPHKALPCFRRAFEGDQHNPYYISFLGLSIARAQQNARRSAITVPLLLLHVLV